MAPPDAPRDTREPSLTSQGVGVPLLALVLTGALALREHQTEKPEDD